MGKDQTPRFRRINWFAEGPLQPYVGAFTQYLTEHGYAASTLGHCLGGMAHFAQWMHTRRLRVHGIGEALVQQFLDEHLPQCQCEGAMRIDRRNASAALTHLLVVLRAQGVIAKAVVRASPVDAELRRYGVRGGSTKSDSRLSVALQQWAIKSPRSREHEKTPP